MLCYCWLICLFWKASYYWIIKAHAILQRRRKCSTELCKVSSNKLFQSFVKFMFISLFHFSFPLLMSMRNYKFISDDWHLSHTAHSCMFLHNISFQLTHSQTNKLRNSTKIKHTYTHDIKCLQVIEVNYSKIDFIATRNFLPYWLQNVSISTLRFAPSTNGGVCNYFNYNFVLLNGFQFTFLSFTRSLAIYVCLTLIY